MIHSIYSSLYLLNPNSQSIPPPHIVEVGNRFKVLDLIDRVPEELWTEAPNTVQEAMIKTILKKKKCKMVV